MTRLICRAGAVASLPEHGITWAAEGASVPPPPRPSAQTPAGERARAGGARARRARGGAAGGPRRARGGARMRIADHVSCCGCTNCKYLSLLTGLSAHGCNLGRAHMPRPRTQNPVPRPCPRRGGAASPPQGAVARLLPPPRRRLPFPERGSTGRVLVPEPPMCPVGRRSHRHVWARETSHPARTRSDHAESESQPWAQGGPRWPRLAPGMAGGRQGCVQAALRPDSGVCCRGAPVQHVCSADGT